MATNKTSELFTDLPDDTSFYVYVFGTNKDTTSSSDAVTGVATTHVRTPVIRGTYLGTTI